MFRTIVEIKPSPLKISYPNRIMTLGSCFAENIGLKMKRVYFDVEINPFGVLYNPFSICNSIELLLNNRSFTENDLFLNRGLWQSFAHSSRFSDSNIEKCLSLINQRLIHAREFLQGTDFLLITFGTAWVYEHKETSRVVSNCHKLPAANFVRRRLSVDEIVTGYSALITKLRSLFPQLHFIFSVSPIRHWKDGAHENNISKSTLHLAVDALQHQFNHLDYFPAYEIQLDELRDYRFFDSDMLHPSDVAVDYIWQRFSETYFNENTVEIKKSIEQLVADLSHRPLFPGSDEFEKFRINIEKRKDKLIELYPFLSERMTFPI